MSQDVKRSDLFDEPLTEEEIAELTAMPSHELYLLDCMVPIHTVRGQIVHRLYHECIKREINAGLGV